MVNEIGPGFFSKMSIPLISGREFTDADTLRGPKVAVVNQEFAKHFFGERGAVGRHIGRGRGLKSPTEIEIVGVVANSLYEGPREGVHRQVFVPNYGNTSVTYYIRAAIPSSAIYSMIRNEVRALDSGMPVYAMKSVETQLDETLLSDRLVALLSAGFGLWFHRSGRTLPDSISARDLGLVTVASHKISRLITRDRVTSAVRAPFTEFQNDAGPGEVNERARGRGLRRAIGELLVCPYCLGMWISAAMTASLLVFPRFTRWFASVLVAFFGSELLHIAYGNQLMLNLSNGLETSERDQQVAAQMKKEVEPLTKQQVIDALTESFKTLRNALETATGGSLTRDVDFWGTKTTRRAVLTTLDTHIAEHLGQLIAYARTNGVVPPWSK